MAKVVEASGHDMKEAREKALLLLGVPEDKVIFEVLEEASKGFFGIIGNKGAKVRATVKEITTTERAYDFLRNVFASMHMDVKIVQKNIDYGCLFSLESEEDMGILIGKHGQTLDALQYLTNLAANRGIGEDRKHIILDIENYRSRREDTLKHLAWHIANKVRRTHHKVTLEPMNRHERKVMHMALQDETDVITYSNGVEPHRRIVVDIKVGK